MAKAKLSGTQEQPLLLLYCPGCKRLHIVNVRPTKAERPSWEWNGSVDSPTCTPSLLIYTSRPDGSNQQTLCHSYITNGQWRFLEDCAHELKGQTVDVPEWKDEYL